MRSDRSPTTERAPDPLAEPAPTCAPPVLRPWAPAHTDADSGGPGVTLCPACLPCTGWGSQRTRTCWEKNSCSCSLQPQLSLRKRAVKTHFLRKEAEKAGVPAMGRLTLGGCSMWEADGETGPDTPRVHFGSRPHGDRPHQSHTVESHRRKDRANSRLCPHPPQDWETGQPYRTENSLPRTCPGGPRGALGKPDHRGRHVRRGGAAIKELRSDQAVVSS